MLVSSTFFFFDNVFFFVKDSVHISATFILQASRHVVPFDKELTHFLIHQFETVPNSKKLQTTPEMWILRDRLH